MAETKDELTEALEEPKPTPFEQMESPQQHISEELQGSSASDESQISVRPRTMTEKGLEYQRETRQKALKAAITKWRKQADYLEDLVVDSEDVEVLQRERQELYNRMDDIDRTLKNLEEIHTYAEDEFFIFRIKQDHRELRTAINNQIKALKGSEKSKSVKSIRHEGGKALSSKSGSVRSIHSICLEEKAKAAEIETRIKWSQKEAAAEKMKLEAATAAKQIEMEKELHVTKVRLQVLEEDEQQSIGPKASELDHLIDEEDANSKVAKYLESIPKDSRPPDFPTTTAVTKTPAPPLFSTPLNVGTKPSDVGPPLIGSITTPSVTFRQYDAPTVDRNMQPGVSVETPRVAFAQQLNPDATQFIPKSTRLEQAEYIPPGSIMDTTLERTTTKVMADLAEQLYVSRIPIPEPPVFSGDPLEYASWKSAFETLIEQKQIPEAEKIHYLKRYLSGKARECVEGYFMYSSEYSYKDAKALLDKRFGDVFVLQNAFRDKLEAMPKLQGNDYVGLQKYSDFLRQCASAAKVIPSLNALSDIRENMRMQAKLPNWLVKRWARVIADHKSRGKGHFPSFDAFVDFVCSEAEIACNPCVYTNFARKNEKPEKGSKSTKRQVFATTALTDNSTETKVKLRSSTKSAQQSKQTNDKTNVKNNDQTQQKTPQESTIQDACQYCERPHDMDICEEFAKQSHEEKRSFCLSKGLCFGCFTQGHLNKDCENRKKCRECFKRHPTAFHDFYKNRTIKRDIESSCEDSPNETVKKELIESATTHSTS